LLVAGRIEKGNPGCEEIVMIDTHGYSLLSYYLHSFSFKPAKHETKRFLGWTALLSFLLLCGGSAFARTTLTPATLAFGDQVKAVTDDGSKSPQTLALAGTGTIPVTLSISSWNFGTVFEGNTSATKSVTLTNNQNFALVFSSIATSGDFAIASNTCGTGIAAGATCAVGVTFSPTATGARTGTLTFSDNAANSPQTVSLTGTGSAPVTVSPASLTFASRPVGLSSAAQTVALKNHLATSLTVSTPVATGDFAVARNTCPASLGPGGWCSVGVTFTPTELGTRTGALTIPYSAFGSPSVIALNGTGSTAVLLSIAITPPNPWIYLPLGQTTQQLAATGTYSDGSTQNLTNTATWSSSAPGVATISATGLASAVALGQTTIEAALGAINGSTTLNVTTFVWTGSMNTGRQGATATLLNDGAVLVAGGGSATAELYNPAAGTFTYTGSMNTARSGHTATLLDNGMVLMAGGSGDTSAELYNPATGTFSYTGSLNTARSGHTATLLDNGAVLIAGGAPGGWNALASAELYNPTTGNFSYTGSMNTARVLHTATLLNNGMVLVAGGNGGYGALANVELYTPSTGNFTAAGTLKVGRWGHTATLLNNGGVLMAGGVAYNGGGEIPTVRAEVYDPATEISHSTHYMNAARAAHTATLLNNGLVLVAGGYAFIVHPFGIAGYVTLASAELYDPSTTGFTAIGNMNNAREYQTATLLNNGLVLIAGGGPASAELYVPPTFTPPNLESIAITPETSTWSLGTTQQFIATGTFSDGTTQQLASMTWSSSDPTVAQITNDASNRGLGLAIAAGTVTITATDGSVSGSATLTVHPTGFVYTTSSLNTPRYDHTATLLNDGTALIAGGIDSSGILSSAELYNSTTGTFSYIHGGLNTARYNHTATLLSNGQVLIAGGHNAVTYLTDAELYNPATGTFALTGGLNTRRAYDTATLLNNGLVLIAGGYTYSSGYLASAELYNPATGTFTLTGNLNTARAYDSATLLDDGTVLIAGGRNSSGYLASAELYDPVTGTFSYATGSLYNARAYHTATLLNNGMVLMAGGEASGYLASAELYNPATGTFTLTGSLNTARAFDTATLLNGGLVLVAGGEASGYLVSAELYNPATGTFTFTGSLNTARAFDTATLLNNGMVLIVGGENKSGALASAELF
jgi:hypothetical protein